MLKKILSIATCGALALTSFFVTFFSLKTIRANASEAEVLLYTLDFTDIPREFLDPHHANSVSGADPNFEAWEEDKLNELKARGFTIGEEFNLGGHDSKFFYQTTPYSYYNGWSNNYEYLDPYAFFLKFEGGTSFEKTLENETRLKIYVDPIEYYWHGAVDFANTIDENYETNVGYADHFSELKTREEAVSLKINDIAISDNITGVIEQDLSGYDTVKIEQDLKGVTVYKMEFYGMPETNNPLKPDDGKSETVIEDKLLYTYDFTQVPYKYLDVNKNYMSTTTAHATFDEHEAELRAKITADGWTLGEALNISGHSGSSFYQTIPGCIFDSDIQDPYAFYLKVESKMSFIKVRKNETRIKIYVDPVSYYKHGGFSDSDYSQQVDFQSRTYPVYLKVNGENVSDNTTAIIECELEGDLISIGRAGSSAGQQAENIYKIEVYGLESSNDGQVVLKKEFNVFNSLLSVAFLLPIVAVVIFVFGKFKKRRKR